MTIRRISLCFRYLCSKCDELCDAKRYTEFRELPPVLHISLLRFVFDMNTLERKKSKHAITFPLSLDMGQFLPRNNGQASKGTRSSSQDIYHLRGILLHKGPSMWYSQIAMSRRSDTSQTRCIPWPLWGSSVRCHVSFTYLDILRYWS